MGLGLRGGMHDRRHDRAQDARRTVARGGEVRSAAGGEQDVPHSSRSTGLGRPRAGTPGGWRRSSSGSAYRPRADAGVAAGARALGVAQDLHLRRRAAPPDAAGAGRSADRPRRLVRPHLARCMRCDCCSSHDVGVRRGCANWDGRKRATDPIASPSARRCPGSRAAGGHCMRRGAPLRLGGGVRIIRGRVGGTRVSGLADSDSRLLKIGDHPSLRGAGALFEQLR